MAADLLNAVEGADMIERVDVRREAAVQAENLHKMFSVIKHEANGIL